MKTFIILFFFFLFYFVTVKDIYDEKMFLTEDVKILEMEMIEKESEITKLKTLNFKLSQQIKELIENKKVKKYVLKPAVKKEVVVTEEVKPTLTDTTKSL